MSLPPFALQARVRVDMTGTNGLLLLSALLAFSASPLSAGCSSANRDAGSGNAGHAGRATESAADAKRSSHLAEQSAKMPNGRSEQSESNEQPKLKLRCGPTRTPGS
jgi:hypothetical protein